MAKVTEGNESLFSALTFAEASSVDLYLLLYRLPCR